MTYPQVADAAVIGVPNADFGEEVKAIVQPLEWADATPEFEAILIVYCMAHLTSAKCPCLVDFDPALPKLYNGKLYKRLLQDRFWQSCNKRV
jgi:long-chain acyl-CoA synthetase